MGTVFLPTSCVREAYLAQTPGDHAAYGVHLEESALGVVVALRVHRVVEGLGEYVGDPLGVPVGGEAPGAGWNGSLALSQLHLEEGEG